MVSGVRAIQVACPRRVPSSKPFRRFSTCVAPLLSRHVGHWSDSYRTLIRTKPDTVPAQTGHQSGPIGKLSDFSPDDCPISIGTLSALNRIAVRLQSESVSDLPRNTHPGKGKGDSTAGALCAIAVGLATLACEVEENAYIQQGLKECLQSSPRARTGCKCCVIPLCIKQSGGGMHWKKVGAGHVVDQPCSKVGQQPSVSACFEPWSTTTRYVVW
jgi:hypothetical protein